MENVWLQQFGATVQTLSQSLTFVKEMFPGHVISLRSDIGWPPRSSDFTLCNVSQLGISSSRPKRKKHHPKNVEALNRK